MASWDFKLEVLDMEDGLLVGQAQPTHMMTCRCYVSHYLQELHTGRNEELKKFQYWTICSSIHHSLRLKNSTETCTYIYS